jgi:hypothetical protein
MDVRYEFIKADDGLVVPLSWKTDCRMENLSSVIHADLE